MGECKICGAEAIGGICSCCRPMEYRMEKAQYCEECASDSHTTEDCPITRHKARIADLEAELREARIARERLKAAVNWAAELYMLDDLGAIPMGQAHTVLLAAYERGRQE